MPITDTNLRVRATSDGAMTVTTVTSSIEIFGTPVAGMALVVAISAIAGAAAGTDTLGVIIRASTSTDPATTDRIVGQLTAIPGSDGVATYTIPFATNKRSVDVEFTVNGTTSESPSWTLDAWVTLNVGPGEKWERAVSFL